MKNKIEQQLEAIKEIKSEEQRLLSRYQYMKNLQRIYYQLEETTLSKLDMGLEEFMELYNYVIKGKL
jgi:L-lactate utilization protein LutB